MQQKEGWISLFPRAETEDMLNNIQHPKFLLLRVVMFSSPKLALPYCFSFSALGKFYGGMWLSWRLPTVRHHKTFTPSERQNIQGRVKDFGQWGWAGPSAAWGRAAWPGVAWLSTWQHRRGVSAECRELHLASCAQAPSRQQAEHRGSRAVCHAGTAAACCQGTPGSNQPCLCLTTSLSGDTHAAAFSIYCLRLRCTSLMF